MAVFYYGELETMSGRIFDNYDDLANAVLEEEERLHINKPYLRENISLKAEDIFVMRRKIANRINAPADNPGSRNLFDDLFDQAADLYGFRSRMLKVINEYEQPDSDNDVAPEGTIFSRDLENGNSLFPIENLALYMADVADRKRNFALKLQNASPEEIFSEKQLLLDELNEVERLASKITLNALDKQVWDSFGAGYFNIQGGKRSEIVSLAHKAALSAGIQANALRRGFSPDDLEVFQEVGNVIMFIDERMVPDSNGIAGQVGKNALEQYKVLRDELLNRQNELLNLRDELLKACNRNVRHPDIRRDVLNEISDVMNRIRNVSNGMSDVMYRLSSVKAPLPQNVNWEAASMAAARQMPPKEEVLVSISPAKAALTSLIGQLSAGETRFNILPPYNSTEYKELISSARQLLSDMETGCDLETEEGRERLNDLRILAANYINAKKDQMRERGKDPEKDMPSSSYGRSRFKAAQGIEKLMNELQMDTRSRRFDRKELVDQQPLKDLVEKETKEYQKKLPIVSEYLEKINEEKESGDREYEKYIKEKGQYQIDSIYQNIIYKEIRAYNRDKDAYEKAKEGCEKEYGLLIKLLKKNEDMAAQNITEDNFSALMRGREFTSDQFQAISRLRNEYVDEKIDEKINSMEGRKLPQNEYQKLREDLSEDFYRIGGKFYLAGDKLTLEEIKESDYSKALNQYNMDLDICEKNIHEKELYEKDPAGYNEAKKNMDKEFSYIMNIIDKDPVGNIFVKATKEMGLSDLASSIYCTEQYKLFFNDIKKQYIESKINDLKTDLQNVYDDKVELSSAPLEKLLDELPSYWKGENTEMPKGKEFLKNHYIKLDRLNNLKHEKKMLLNGGAVERRLSDAKILFDFSKRALLKDKNNWLPDLPPEKEYLRKYYEDAQRLKKLEAEANKDSYKSEELQEMVKAKEEYKKEKEEYKKNIADALEELEKKRTQFGAQFDRVIGKYYKRGGENPRTIPIINPPEYAYEQYDEKVMGLTRELKEKTGLSFSEAVRFKKPKRVAEVLTTSINEIDNREGNVSLNSSSRRNSLSLEKRNSKVL